MQFYPNSNKLVVSTGMANGLIVLNYPTDLSLFTIQGLLYQENYEDIFYGKSAKVCRSIDLHPRLPLALVGFYMRNSYLINCESLNVL